MMSLQKNADDIEAIKQLINHNMTVEAVKMVRKITGLGLIEAKTFVDEIQKQEKCKLKADI